MEHMNANQQHMLDLYRSAKLGEPAPPAPGTGDLGAVREFRTWREFQAVVDERTVVRRGRWTALFRRPRPMPGRTAGPARAAGTASASASATAAPAPAAVSLPDGRPAGQPVGQQADPRCRA